MALIRNLWLVVLGVILIFFSAWITHILNCLSTERYLLLIGGAIAFPVGIIHGIGIWFGVF